MVVCGNSRPWMDFHALGNAVTLHELFFNERVKHNRVVVMGQHFDKRHVYARIPVQE